jgi:hypothetical protein
MDSPGQTLNAPAPFFIMRILFPLTSLLFFTFPGAAGAQVHSKTGTVGTAAAEHAASLAETGHC